MSNIKTQVYRPRQSSFVDRIGMTNSGSQTKLRPTSGVKYAPKNRPQTAMLTQTKTEHKYANININIIEQIGGKKTKVEESDNQIERLKDQCEAHNKDIYENNDVDALEQELQQLMMQLQDSVKIRNANQQENQRNQQDIVELRGENSNLREKFSNFERQKKEIHSQIERQNENIMVMEEKVYKANKISLELLEQLNTQVIVEYGSLIYYPVKGDEIDMQLADYLNNYPDRSKLLVMFVRESQGVYLFGTKKVFIKVYNNRIMVRVGGGYLSIDEFLEQYTPLELEKLAQRGQVDMGASLLTSQYATTKDELLEQQQPAFLSNQKNQKSPKGQPLVSRYSPKVYMKNNGRGSPNPNSTSMNASTMLRSKSKEGGMNMSQKQWI